MSSKESKRRNKLSDEVFKKSSSDKKYCLEEKKIVVVVPSQDVITTRSSRVRRQNRLFDQFLALLKKIVLNLLGMIFKPNIFGPIRKCPVIKVLLLKM